MLKSVRMKYWLILPMAVVLAGCAHYQPQPLSPDRSASQLISRRLDDAGLRSFMEKNQGRPLTAWPLAQWTLDDLTLAAFYFHPNLEVARQQWLLATAGEKTAAARLNPSMTVNPSYDSGIPGNYSPWIVPVTFDIPIETAGKRGKRMAEAAKLAESARWSFVSAAWQIRSDVRTALVELKLNERRRSLLQKQLQAQTETVKLIQQRFDIGEISRPELTVAQIALNKAQLDLAGADAAVVDARSKLAESLGLTTEAVQGLTTKFNLTAVDSADLKLSAARDRALRGRADILGALADYAAVEADLQLQVARQYPDLHLGPGYAWNNGNAGDNQWSLGLTLELPILDQNQGPIAEARARRELAAAKFLALQAQIIAQIDRAVAGVKSAAKQQAINRAQVDAANQQLNSVSDQVKAGAAESLDVLDARLNLYVAQAAGIDGEGQLATAVGALEDALQQPDPAISKAVADISTDK